jgi:hypothetical protein
MAAKRVTFRYRTQRSAKLFLGDGTQLECGVCDLSTKGAGLEIPNLKNLPAEFSIVPRSASQVRQVRYAII